MIHFDLPKEKSSIIKVIGIGGGGSNAVNHMFSLGIEGVNFIVCNTDSQAISGSPVPNKVQLGPHLTQGLGAGANPEIGRQATEESFEELRKILEVNTKMAFITAGMGGGTGTGGAPIIARICRELGILTVAIVTMPFSYEGKKRMLQAEEGINKLNEHVDTLLIISNDKLRHQFGDLPFKAAFSKADNILATAAKCITDIINQHGHINVDFADVCTAMKNGGVAILGSATAEGDNRAHKAIEDALSSPLLNDSNINGAKWILLNITSCEGEYEHTIDEMDTIQAYVQHQAGDDCDVILGVGYNNELGNKLGVTIIATGFDQRPIKTAEKPPVNKEEEKEVFVLGKNQEEQEREQAQEKEEAKKKYNQATIEFQEDDLMPKLIETEQQAEAYKKEQEQKKATQAQRIHFEMNEKKEDNPPQNEEKPTHQAGGYLKRPSSIYIEPIDEKKEEKDEQPVEPEEDEQEMKLIIKDEQNEEKPAEPEQPQDKKEEEREQQEQQEERQQKNAERIAKLRNMSYNIKNFEAHQEVENVPAYVRQNINLEDETPQDNVYSGYTVKASSDKKKTEINTINTFLEGRNPD